MRFLKSFVLCWGLLGFQDESGAGILVRFIFDGNPGPPASLSSDPRYPDRPTRKEIYNQGLTIQGAGYPQVNSGEVFTALVRGYLTPPETGPYVFFIHSDDASQFYLSTDTNPANKVLRCQETGANQGWLEDGIRSSGPIALEAGRQYYFEVIHTENRAGDHFTVAWRLPSGPFEAPIGPGYVAPLPLDPITHEVIATAPVIPEGLYHGTLFSGHPADVRTGVGAPAVFSAGFHATPPFTFQWRRNGTPIPGATNGQHVISEVSPLDAGERFDVVITNPQGSVTSRWATVNFAPVTNALPFQITKAVTRGNPNGVDLVFSQPLDESTATNAAHYTIDQGVSVSRAEMLNNTTVRLTTTPLQTARLFTLTASTNIRSAGSQPLQLTPAGNTRVFVQARNSLERRFFFGVNGGSPNDLIQSGRLPLLYNHQDLIFELESWPTSHDQYGIQVRGYLIPHQTGQYVFSVVADDGVWLYLSTDETEANKARIAMDQALVLGSGFRQYTAGTGQGGRVDPNAGTVPSNRSLPVSLEQGKRYYIEVIMKEAGGGDHFSVTWERVGGKPAVNDDPPVPDIFLSSLSPDAPVQITREPADVQTTLSESAQFSVEAQGTPPLRYQWIRNGEILRGETRPQLVIPVALQEDAAAEYRVVVLNPFSSQTSRVARIVLPAATRFELAGANGGSDLKTVDLTFTRPLAPGAADSVEPFEVTDPFGNPLLVHSAELLPGGSRIRLHTEPQISGQPFLVTVEGIQDAQGGGLPPNSRALFLSWIHSPGTVKFDVYHYIPGLHIADLLSSYKFPNHPEVRSLLSSLETPANFSEFYGARVSGWLSPTMTGMYRFFIQADDSAQFFLSQDASPARKSLLLHNQNAAGGYAENVGTRNSGPIYLEAGRHYYMEALVKEHGGGDFLRIAWRRQGDPTPLANLTPIAGENLVTLEPPLEEAILILSQPQPLTVTEGETATLSVDAIGTRPGLEYQWWVDSVPLPGATGPTFTTPPLQLENDGLRVFCLVSLGGTTVATTEVILTVVESAGNLKLTIDRLPGGVRVSWPSNYTGSTLQRADRLSLEAWQDVPGSGTVNFMEFPLEAGRWFYRLRR